MGIPAAVRFARATEGVAAVRCSRRVAIKKETNNVLPRYRGLVFTPFQIWENAGLLTATLLLQVSQSTKTLPFP